MRTSKADKTAFESLLRDRQIRFDDLSNNDNRSQSQDVERNLDYLLHFGKTRQMMIELEGREMVKGRIQPSLAWCKQLELEEMLRWENDRPKSRQAVLVFAFRSEQTPLKHIVDITLGDVHYVFLAVHAREYRDSHKVRCSKSGWTTVDLKKGEFDRLSHRFIELLQPVRSVRT